MMVQHPNTTICFSVSNILAAPYNDSSYADDPFVKNRVVITASNIRQYIFPGVVELLELLFETKNITVAFCAGQDEERDKEFVSLLLSLVLGPKRYRDVKNSIPVLTKKTVLVESIENARLQEARFGFEQQFLKKDISKLVPHDTPLDNVLLVDTNTAQVACGREGNFFCVPFTRARDYTAFDLDHIEERSIDFCFAHFSNMQDFIRHRKNIVTHKYILVAYIDAKCILFYTDKHSNEPCFYTFAPDELEVLGKNCPIDGCYSSTIVAEKAPALSELLVKILEKHNGKMQRMYRQVNHIYFMAGAIFEAIQIAAFEQKSVSRVFFDWQFRQVGNKYEQTFDELQANERLYRLGLELLRKKNPHLHFHSTIRPLTKGESGDLSLG